MKPSASIAEPPADQIPPYAVAAFEGALENAATTPGVAVETATIQPTPPSPYAPKGTYSVAPSALRFSAPRCERTVGPRSCAGPMPLTGPTAASSRATGQPGKR